MKGISLLLMQFLTLSCAQRDLPDSLDKNNIPSELETGKKEEMVIPESDDGPLLQNPLEEPNPRYPPP